jgi:hypothetical protein
MFVQHRDVASRTLSIEPLNTILADSRITNFKVDGHHVFSPVGFPAKSIQALSELTFISRGLFDDLKKQFHGSLYVIDYVRVAIEAITKTTVPPFGFLLLDVLGSYYFHTKPMAWGFEVKRTTVPWSIEGKLQTISETWNVSRSSAEAIYQEYQSGNMAPKVLAHWKKVFTADNEHLEATLKKIGVKGTVFVCCGQSRPVQLKANKAVIYGSLPLARVLERSGFVLDEVPNGMTDEALFPYVAAFLGYFSSRGHEDVNHWLRRRLHWLGSIHYN